MIELKLECQQAVLFPSHLFTIRSYSVQLDSFPFPHPLEALLVTTKVDIVALAYDNF